MDNAYRGHYGAISGFPQPAVESIFDRLFPAEKHVTAQYPVERSSIKCSPETRCPWPRILRYSYSEKIAPVSI
jgi:hypothetical protein